MQGAALHTSDGMQLALEQRGADFIPSCDVRTVEMGKRIAPSGKTHAEKQTKRVYVV